MDTTKDDSSNLNAIGLGFLGIAILFLLTAKGRDAARDIVTTPQGWTAGGAAKLRKQAALLARAQFAYWGGRSETSFAIKSRLLEYWMRGGNRSKSGAEQEIASRSYWSAAFISWLFRVAGAGTSFKYSAAHTVYCAAAKKNRLANRTLNPFWLFRPSEFAPRVGDLLCNARDGSGLTFENVDDGNPRASHCNIVVSVAPGRLEVIGGNLGDTVSLEIVRTDSKGFVSGQDFYAVLRVGA
jgi:hypothetical protein